MFETFTNRSVETETEFPFGWPATMQRVGESLGVAYGSDKWKPKKNGRRDSEVYKHIAESRNLLFAVPGRIECVDGYKPVGPRVRLAEIPMPDTFAYMGTFEEANAQLYRRSGRSFVLPDDPDDLVVAITLRYGMVGGSKIRWSAVGAGKDEPFLFVYTEDDGVVLLVVGEKLDVEADGIVG